MPLNITVTTDYRITSDSLQFIVNKRHIVDPTKSPNWPRMKAEGHNGQPREEWKEISYHNTLEHALKWIVNQRIRESDATDMVALLSEIKRFNREIKALMTGEGTGEAI